MPEQRWEIQGDGDYWAASLSVAVPGNWLTLPEEASGSGFAPTGMYYAAGWFGGDITLRSSQLTAGSRFIKMAIPLRAYPKQRTTCRRLLVDLLAHATCDYAASIAFHWTLPYHLEYTKTGGESHHHAIVRRAQRTKPCPHLTVLRFRDPSAQSAHRLFSQYLRCS
ncbi:hypothetical protein PWT90_03537 [Aphanocladium album]|nr:hypothetical protein PWT90_03537 [Aphanocladium album]